jgi:hypothetical protein
MSSEAMEASLPTESTASSEHISGNLDQHISSWQRAFCDFFVTKKDAVSDEPHWYGLCIEHVINIIVIGKCRREFTQRH